MLCYQLFRDEPIEHDRGNRPSFGLGRPPADRGPLIRHEDVIDVLDERRDPDCVDGLERDPC